ncbi:MAG TPA: alpha-amylase family glycosyl hydrolase [Streptosporangiaceae bacterium]|nr:alpha-amylase family glycosyl hydrolase [Streptosporangiaceae bacterium]
MTDKATSDLWWKNAVIYCADVATWLDSDGDGIGDLAGLTRRLDYLWGLGVNTLWLMPFYPSPLGARLNRDGAWLAQVARLV